MNVSAQRFQVIALIVAGAFFMQNLDGAIINTSLPQMAATFHVRALDLSAGITAYVIAAAACLPLSGWTADRFGARRVFSLAIVVFTLASIACGAARSLEQFILARAVQGAGGALMAPVGRAVVLRHAAKSELLRAIALITWPALLAPILAPVIGGGITTYFSWRWNFLLNAPLGLAAVLLVRAYLPDERPSAPRPLDLIGLTLTSVALLCLLYGLESLSGGRLGWRLSLALVALGALTALAAWRHLQRAVHPLINLAPLRVASFAAANAGAGLVFRTTIAATPFLLPLLFQVAFGLTPLASGWLIMVYFIGNLAMKPATSPMVRRYGFRRVLIVNGLLSGAAILACASLDPHSAAALTLPVLLLAGLTRSMQFTCLNTLGFADLDHELSSAGSTLASMLVQIAMAAGVGMSALILHAAPHLHGSAVASLGDYRLAFAAVGVLGMLSALRFTRLAPLVGAHVSGHAATPPPHPPDERP
jgi:EmrB/QacA subfamily drug resistance transporter